MSNLGFYFFGTAASQFHSDQITRLIRQTDLIWDVMNTQLKSDGGKKSSGGFEPTTTNEYVRGFREVQVRPPHDGVLKVAWVVYPDVEPSVDDFTIVERTMNQYSMFESYHNGKSGQSHSRYNAKRIRALWRDESGWNFADPRPLSSELAAASSHRTGTNVSKLLRTSVTGIESKQRKNRSTNQDTYREFGYRVYPKYVTQSGEAFILEWDEKHRSSVEGESTTRSNKKAYRMCLSDN
jgi:hypothetical protein